MKFENELWRVVINEELGRVGNNWGNDNANKVIYRMNVNILVFQNKIYCYGVNIVWYFELAVYNVTVNL